MLEQNDKSERRDRKEKIIKGACDGRQKMTQENARGQGAAI